MLNDLELGQYSDDIWQQLIDEHVQQTEVLELLLYRLLRHADDNNAARRTVITSHLVESIAWSSSMVVTAMQTTRQMMQNDCSRAALLMPALRLATSDSLFEQGDELLTLCIALLHTLASLQCPDMARKQYAEAIDLFVDDPVNSSAATKSGGATFWLSWVSCMSCRSNYTRKPTTATYAPATYKTTLARTPPR